MDSLNGQFSTILTTTRLGATSKTQVFIEPIAIGNSHLRHIPESIEMDPNDDNGNDLTGSFPDLFAIFKGPGSGSNSTEVHVLSASSGYQDFVLQTGTRLPETGANFSFDIGDWILWDSEHPWVPAQNRVDLLAVKSHGTGTNSTERFIVDGESGYQQWDENGLGQLGSVLPETPSGFEYDWADWDGDGTLDLFAIGNGFGPHRPHEVYIVGPWNRGYFEQQQPKPTVNLTASRDAVAEGNGVTYTATVTVPYSSNVTIPISIGGSVGSSDYTTGGLSGGRLTIPAGSQSRTFTVSSTNDTLDENTETVTVSMGTPTNAYLGHDSSHSFTIADNDPRPNFSINDVSVTEGDSGTKNATFTVTLSAASGLTTRVSYATANHTAVAGSDFNSVSGTLTFPPGDRTKTITVPVRGDVLDEINEQFYVNLSGASNAGISDTRGVGTINDNDPVPNFSINDVSVNRRGTPEL